MAEENPTTGDSGASIEDRLTAYLSADSAVQQPKEEAKQDPVQELDKAIPDNAEASDEPTDGAQQEESQPQISTADLAKLWGLEESAIDVDSDGQPVFKTKIDGKEVPAKLADLLKDYQIRGHAENKAREAAEAVKAADARRQEVEQQVQQRLAHVEQLANVAASELMREYQSIDWGSLRQTDPGQYAALQQDFQNRKAQLHGVFQNVQQQNAVQKAQAEKAKAEYLAQEADRLPQVIPEWKDASIAKRESGEILEWGLKSGYTREQLNALNESSALHIATVRKAMLFDKLQQSKPAIENKVRLAPKIVKPGESRQEDPKTENLRSLKQTIKSSGGKRGVAEWLIATGKV